MRNPLGVDYQSYRSLLVQCWDVVTRRFPALLRAITEGRVGYPIEYRILLLSCKHYVSRALCPPRSHLWIEMPLSPWTDRKSWGVGEPASAALLHSDVLPEIKKYRR